MSSAQLVEHALALPEAERIELARKLVASVAVERDTEKLAEEGVRRIADVFAGRTAALSEDEFRRALK